MSTVAVSKEEKPCGQGDRCGSARPGSVPLVVPISPALVSMVSPDHVVRSDDQESKAPLAAPPQNRGLFTAQNSHELGHSNDHHRGHEHDHNQHGHNPSHDDDHLQHVSSDSHEHTHYPDPRRLTTGTPSCSPGYQTGSKESLECAETAPPPKVKASCCSTASSSSPLCQDRITSSVEKKEDCCSPKVMTVGETLHVGCGPTSGPHQHADKAGHKEDGHGCCSEGSSCGSTTEEIVVPGVMEARRLLQLCCDFCWGAKTIKCGCKTACCTISCCLGRIHEEMKKILSRQPGALAASTSDAKECKSVMDGDRRETLLPASADWSSTSQLGGIPAAAIGESATVSLQVNGLTCADCSHSVEQKLLTMAGVSAARVSSMTGRADITYDPSSSFSPVTAAKEVETLGFSASVLEPSSAHSVEFLLKMDNMAGLDEFVLDKLIVRSILVLRCEPGVIEESVTHRFDKKLDQRSIRVGYDPALTGPRRLLAILQENERHFEILPSVRNSGVDHVAALQRSWSRRFWLSAALCLPVIFIAFIFPAIGGGVQEAMDHLLTRGLSVSTLLLFLLSTPIQFFIGWPLYDSAYRALRYGHTANSDTLVMLSTSVAYFYSIISVIASMAGSEFTSEHFFETSAVLLTLIVLGRYLEALAKGKTSDVLDKLMAMTVTRATLLVDYDEDKHESQREEELDMVLIQRGDVIKVLPGTRIATDGIIIWGSTSVDESMVTGESVPVVKQPGDLVLGSTVNENGLIHVRVTRTIGENTLSNISQLVQEAQNSQPPVQRIADKVAGYFVPSILLLTLGVFIVWLSLAATNVVSTDRGSVTFALRFAIATLIISCPCAIGLAVPTAVMAGSGVAAQHGVVFKSGATIERSAKVTAIVLDKTGTLTQGKPSVSSYLDLADSGTPSPELWRWVGSAESGSEHPLAMTLLAFSKQQLQLPSDETLPAPESFESVPGRGIKCIVHGHRVCIGTMAWMQQSENQVAVSSRQQSILDLQPASAETHVFAAIDGELQVMIRLSDELKPQARELISQLHGLNLQAWMCSGDSNSTALIVGERAGLSSDHILGGQLPGDKASLIRRLQSEGHVVAMVGDGINDSPALAQADVGIAVARGTDIAGEAAHVLLMKDDLLDIVLALHLARRTFATIRWNFTWAFLYNLLAIPLAMGVFYPLGDVAIPPPLAGLSELLSSLPVVLFSLMLRFYRPPQPGQAAMNNQGLRSIRLM